MALYSDFYFHARVRLIWQLYVDAGRGTLTNAKNAQTARMREVSIHVTEGGMRRKGGVRGASG